MCLADKPLSGISHRLSYAGNIRCQSQAIVSPSKRVIPSSRSNETGHRNPNRQPLEVRHSPANEPGIHQGFVLLDPPQHDPEDMISFDHPTTNGGGHPLV